MSRAVLAVLGTLTYVAACGKAHDCALNSSLHDINVSASRWDPFALEWRRKLNRRKAEARVQCEEQKAGVTTTGAYDDVLAGCGREHT